MSNRKPKKSPVQKKAKSAKEATRSLLKDMHPAGRLSDASTKPPRKRGK